MKNLKILSMLLVSILILSSCQNTDSDKKTSTPSEETSLESEATASTEQEKANQEQKLDEAETKPDQTEAKKSESKPEISKSVEKEAGQDKDTKEEVQDNKKAEQANSAEEVLEIREELDTKAAYQEVLVKGEDEFEFAELKIEDFKTWMNEEDRPIFLDFWAPWCGPCRMASPDIDKLKASYGDKIRVLKINVDHMDVSLSAMFPTQVIPNFFLLNEGETIQQWEGTTSTYLDEVRAALDKLLAE